MSIGCTLANQRLTTGTGSSQQRERIFVVQNKQQWNLLPRSKRPSNLPASLNSKCYFPSSDQWWIRKSAEKTILTTRNRKFRPIIRALSREVSQPWDLNPGPPSVLPRSALLAKQVVARTSGKILGVVTQIWVDIRKWEVLALHVRLTPFTGPVDTILLSRISQIGDVLLVDSEDVIETRLNVIGCQYLVGTDVVTAKGTYLGKVRDFAFQPQDGRLRSIILDDFGVPLIPSTLMSTYELPLEEILLAQPEQITVQDDAYKRWRQLTTGLVERVFFSSPSQKRTKSQPRRLPRSRQVAAIKAPVNRSPHSSLPPIPRRPMIQIPFDKPQRQSSIPFRGMERTDTIPSPRMVRMDKIPSSEMGRTSEFPSRRVGRTDEFPSREMERIGEFLSHEMGRTSDTQSGDGTYPEVSFTPGNSYNLGRESASWQEQGEPWGGDPIRRRQLEAGCDRPLKSRQVDAEATEPMRGLQLDFSGLPPLRGRQLDAWDSQPTRVRQLSFRGRQLDAPGTEPLQMGQVDSEQALRREIHESVTGGSAAEEPVDVWGQREVGPGEGVFWVGAVPTQDAIMQKRRESEVDEVQALSERGRRGEEIGQLAGWDWRKDPQLAQPALKADIGNVRAPGEEIRIRVSPLGESEAPQYPEDQEPAGLSELLDRAEGREIGDGQLDDGRMRDLLRSEPFQLSDRFRAEDLPADLGRGFSGPAIGQVTPGEVPPGSVTERQTTPDQVTAGQITPDPVRAGQITLNQMTAGQVTPHQVSGQVSSAQTFSVEADQKDAKFVQGPEKPTSGMCRSTEEELEGGGLNLAHLHVPVQAENRGLGFREDSDKNRVEKDVSVRRAREPLDFY